MGEMLIFYMIIVGLAILQLVFIVKMLIKGSKRSNIYLVSIYPVLLGIIAITSFPSNFIFKKVVSGMFLVLGIIPIIGELLGKRVSKRVRDVLIIASIVGNLIMTLY